MSSADTETDRRSFKHLRYTKNWRQKISSAGINQMTHRKENARELTAAIVTGLLEGFWGPGSSAVNGSSGSDISSLGCAYPSFIGETGTVEAGTVEAGTGETGTGGI